jgi:SNF2 family DNA or RNA helicase
MILDHQIIESERAILVETDDPATLLARVPAAFQLEPRIVGMPHDIECVARLALMGVQVESPIEKYYHWPRDKTLIPFPFKHQITQSAFLVTHPRAYILSSIGVGKTMSAAWAADYLISLGFVHRVLVVSTLSSLERTWGDAIFCNLTHRTFKVLHGAADRRKKLLAQPADFYIVNYAGVGVLQKELLARPDIDLVILDESAECGKKTTGLWKSLDMLIYPPHRAPIPRVWAMTATPIPNSPEDAFPQLKLVTPTTAPQYFSQWRAMVMDHQSTYVWTPRQEATNIVYNAMRPSIRFKRDDCLDLPPAIYTTRDVELSAEQKKHYKEISKELHTEINGARVTALNEGIKLSKLLQVACGCVYATDGTAHEIDAGNRIETLMEIIEQVNERVIVYCPFEAVTGMLARALNKHWNFAVVTGQTPHRERDKIFSQFQSRDADIDIVAHPGCMAHSLTLTEASTIVWYAPVDSNRTYEQANGRITRAGQKYTANIIHLAGSAVERRMYRRLQDRQSAQGLLLSMVEKNEALI